ncbi:uncharacterized protein [Procambarus clarkii]|uniref:uncharacterized protein isoform X2 n=1 Tax=Procambarus clarkii TaxID=6728 RepID=UPI001E678D41|nr:uncharacterized protein LOC123766327 isoform X2 [Procambarus clarkii]
MNTSAAWCSSTPFQLLFRPTLQNFPMNCIILVMLVSSLASQTAAGLPDFLGNRPNLGSISSGPSRSSDDTNDTLATDSFASSSQPDHHTEGTYLRTGSNAFVTSSGGGGGPTSRSSPRPVVRSGKTNGSGASMNVIGDSSGRLGRRPETGSSGLVINVSGGKDVDSGPRVTAGSSSSPPSDAGPRYGSPQVSRVDAVFHPTVTQLVTVDRFVTLTDQAFQSVAVTLTSLTVQTVTTGTRRVVETAVNDHVTLQTSLTARPTSLAVTHVKSSFSLVTDTALHHLTTTYTSYVIMLPTDTTTTMQSVVHKDVGAYERKHERDYGDGPPGRHTHRAHKVPRLRYTVVVHGIFLAIYKRFKLYLLMNYLYL